MEYIEVQASVQRKKQPSSEPENLDPGAAANSELDDVGGLRSFLTLGHVEAYPLVFLQGAEPAVLDGGVVNEKIGTAFVGRNETETLFRVEPLHGALSHSNFLEISLESSLPRHLPGEGPRHQNPPARGFLAWEREMGYFQKNNIRRGKGAKEKIWFVRMF
jgi:hypothetical protein